MWSVMENYRYLTRRISEKPLNDLATINSYAAASRFCHQLSQHRALDVGF
jgi:hypothetical protein